MAGSNVMLPLKAMAYIKHRYKVRMKSNVAPKAYSCVRRVHFRVSERLAQEGPIPRALEGMGIMASLSLPPSLARMGYKWRRSRLMVLFLPVASQTSTLNISSYFLLMFQMCNRTEEEKETTLKLRGHVMGDRIC